MLKTNLPFYKSPIIMIGIGLFFVLVFATMYRIYIAFDTHPGLVVENAYEKGRDYAITLAKKKKLQKQGWKIFLELPKKLSANVKQTYRVNVIQGNSNLSKNNTDNKVTLFFYRPSSVKKDFQVNMIKVGGYYIADVIVTAKGRWDVTAQVNINNVALHKGREVFYQ